MAIFLSALAFCMAGLLAGSFANQAIHRLPRGERLFRPAPQCPFCHHPLAARDMVPIASYFYLRGGCRYCVASIAPRYLLVEALTAGLFALCSLRFGWSAALAAALFLSLAMVICAFVDAEHALMLDEILLIGGIAALGLNCALSALCLWWEALLGAAAGALPLAALAGAGRLLGQRSAFRGGDIKLMAMAGAFLGWQNVLLALALAWAGPGLFMAASRAAGKVSPETKAPLVARLCFGSVASLLIGDGLVNWCVGLFQ